MYVGCGGCLRIIHGCDSGDNVLKCCRNASLYLNRHVWFQSACQKIEATKKWLWFAIKPFETKRFALCPVNFMRWNLVAKIRYYRNSKTFGVKNHHFKEKKRNYFFFLKPDFSVNKVFLWWSRNYQEYRAQKKISIFSYNFLFRANFMHLIAYFLFYCYNKKKKQDRLIK